MSKKVSERVGAVVTVARPWVETVIAAVILFVVISIFAKYYQP